MNWQYDWECICKHWVKILRIRNEWLDVAVRLSNLTKILDARLIVVTCMRSKLVKMIKMDWWIQCEVYDQYKW